MFDEELSKGILKSVSKPCSRNDLCGSYRHIENYNGRPVYKRDQNTPYNTEIYLYYQMNGSWCLTSGSHYRRKADTYHICYLFNYEAEHELNSDVRKMSGSWSQTDTDGLPDGFWIVKIKDES